MSSIEVTGGRALRFGSVPLVMGIINVTPDSFSDGGLHISPSVAIENALQMEIDGAAVIDIGGESTRPGSAGVSEEEELERVLPVVRGLRDESDVLISIDTTKAAVARAALEAGADIVNDVSALRADAGMIALIAERRCPAILMHMRGEPRTMQEKISFKEVVEEVAEELGAFVQAAIAGGIALDRLLIDPGIGFGKTFEQNAELLRSCARFTRIAPVVIGASRKAFIGNLTGQPNGAARMAGSLGAIAAAARGGAHFVRVHDVRETVDFLKVFAAVSGSTS